MEVSDTTVGDIISISDVTGGKASLIFASFQESEQKKAVRCNCRAGVLMRVVVCSGLAEKIAQRGIAEEGEYRKAMACRR